MSSAAVQQNTPQQYINRYAIGAPGPTATSSSTPPSSRQTGKRPIGNAAVLNTPQQAPYTSSPAGSGSAAMTTPRGQVMPPPSQASPAEPLSNSTYQQFYPDSSPAGPAVALPIRTSSQQAPTSVTSASTANEAGIRSGLEAGSERDRISDSERRQRTQKSPRDEAGSASRTQRSRQAPVQSRSATNVGQPPVDTSLPRENSAIITHIVVDDPQADLAREQARIAEAQPNVEGATMPAMIDQTIPADPEQKQRSRQEHLKQPSHRKEVKFGDYILGQTLGEGEFGKVKMGWKRDSSVQVAIKLIRKESLQNNANRLPKIYREISILRELQHPNIVRLHEFVETERHMGIILEYASGGELFDFILNQRYLKDPQARRLFAQLVSGVGYLHKKGIVHRDLKLENLLLDRNRNIIITDFGFANTFNPNDELGEEIEHRITDKDFVKRERLGEANADGMRRGDLMQTSCGSPCYAAPELVVSDGLYTGRKVDVWSCGVILYAMLAGYLPFDDDPANPEGDNINLLYKYIVSTPLTFPEYVTPHARDLLRRILVPDPRRRADLFEVARHSWLSEYSHVVGFIGSSTKSDADIAASAMRQGDEVGLGRSASVREPASKSPAVSDQRLAARAEDAQGDTRGTTRDAKRRTVQLEYVAPKDATGRVETAAAAAPIVPLTAGKTRARGDVQNPVEVLPSSQREPQVARKEVPAAREMPPPARPSRDTQRAASDMPVSTGQGTPFASRPGTSGTLGSARLPSRGNSYSQPALPAPTNTNVQAQLSQPKSSSGYIISGPVQLDQAAQSSRPVSQQNLAQFQLQQERKDQQARGHKRSSTLSSIGDRILGRSSSRRSSQQQQEAGAPAAGEKKSRKYPPLSMKNPIPNDQEIQPRPSTESARRTSFGFSRKSSDVPSESKRSSRRFSFLPSGLTNLSGKRDPSYDSRPAYSGDSRPPSKGVAFGQGASRTPSESTNSTIPLFYDNNAARQPRTPGAPSTQQSMYEKALPQPPTPQNYAAQTAAQPTYPKQPIPQPYPSTTQNYSSPPPSQKFPTPPPVPRKTYRDDGYGSSTLDQTQIQDPVERFYTPTGDIMPTSSPVSQQYSYINANAVRTQPYSQQGYSGNTTGGNEYDSAEAPELSHLRPNQRNFASEQYERGYSGSSSATRRVMDFFRRRGKDRSEGS